MVEGYRGRLVEGDADADGVTSGALCLRGEGPAMEERCERWDEELRHAVLNEERLRAKGLKRQYGLDRGSAHKECRAEYKYRGTVLSSALQIVPDREMRTVS